MSYVSEVEGPDGGTEQHYGEDSETESGAITCFRTSKGRLACNVPEHGQETRDTKTQLDSLWFPQAVAAYLDGHGKNFDFAVLMDSDTLFVGLVPSNEFSDGTACPVFQTAMKVPWSDNPAEAGWQELPGVGSQSETPKGYARINCGVVLLNLADPSLAARTWDVDTCRAVLTEVDAARRRLQGLRHVSAVMMELHQAVSSTDGSSELAVKDAVYSAAARNLTLWLQWQALLVKEFRGNDQAGLALLVSSFRTDDLQYLLGWENCIICEESYPAQLRMYAGEGDLTVRFRALPARILNHPEAMVDGTFPPELRVVHLKGLWWRMAVGKGVLTSTATREPAMPIRAEDHITWGGSVLPRIDTLDPRIRGAGVALERFYLPKLVENGYSADPAIGRIIAAAGLKPRRQKALPSHSKVQRVGGWSLGVAQGSHIRIM
ncbi:unnamed protein product [Effrenium voratum]|nr:unnamed protein product [Effrenium voratum]